MAGDFSKANIFMPASRLGFLTRILRNINQGKNNNPDKFFQVYYDPLLSGIFADYHKELSETKE